MAREARAAVESREEEVALFNAYGARLQNLGEPVAGSDAVSKEYVDGHDEESRACGAKQFKGLDELESGIARSSGLSVARVTNDEYCRVVGSELSTCLSSTLFVIEDDYFSLMGKTAKQAGAPVEDDDLATKAYVDNEVAKLAQRVAELEALLNRGGGGGEA